MSTTLLIVDDEQQIRQMVRRLAETLSLDTLEAESGEQALERMQQHAVDLILTDLKMPGMDGLELAQQLLLQDPDRPVLLMTAYADLDSARKAVHIGIYEYFSKPFDITDMAAGLRRALEHRRLLLENQAYQKDLEQKVAERTRDLQVKVQQLEARDTLLTRMLSLSDPQETLNLAVKLNLNLCACDTGVLYIQNEAGLSPRTIVGYDTCPPLVSGFDRVLKDRKPIYIHNPDTNRKNQGVHSLGVLPVFHGDEIVALLEVGRKHKDTPINEADLAASEDFVPYLSLALNDCRLDDELPNWADDMEDVLKEVDDWPEK